VKKRPDRRIGNSGYKKSVDPTPAEIEERKAEIRAEWKKDHSWNAPERPDPVHRLSGIRLLPVRGLPD
jgi:hypothetical protein